MIITFCGHRDFFGNEELKERMTGELLALAGQTETLFCYSGGYGGFDRFAAHCVKEAKKKAGNIRNILVIPYLTVSVQAQLKECEGYFDEVIYPALENVPPKCAIIRRNEWMVDKADLLIAYVTHGWGGAARTYRYAKQKGIPTVNLAEAKNA